MDDNFEIPYDKNGLGYIQLFKREIKEYSDILGVSALGVAGSILRENTATSEIYSKKYYYLFEPYDSFRALVLSGLTHEDFANDYNGSLLIDPLKLSIFGKIRDQIVSHPDIRDIGRGRIRINVAIKQLLRDQAAHAGGSDPLDLSQYYDRYDLLVQDLLDNTKGTTIKIAALITQSAEAYLKGNTVDGFSNPSHDPKYATSGQWQKYFDGERAALDVKIYSTGIETVERETSGFWQYNMAGNGSNIVLYDQNLIDLYNALGIEIPKRLELQIDKKSSVGQDQYLNIDYLTPSSQSPDQEFKLKFYDGPSKPAAYVENKDVGQVRVDVFKKITLTKGADTLFLSEIKETEKELIINFGDNFDTIDVTGGKEGNQKK